MSIDKQQRAEKDPYGYAANQPGAKLDAGKARAGLVLGDFSRALAAVVDVGTYGANKYSDRGWLSVPNGISRYDDAGMRHYLDRKRGIEFDPETRLRHLAHQCWNDLAQLELVLREQEQIKVNPYVLGVSSGV